MATRPNYLTEEGQLTELAKYRLSKPFDPGALYFLPTDVKDKKATALVYANARVYQERLDEVFGAENWSTDVSLTTAPYKKEIAERKGNDGKVWREASVKEGHKIFAKVTLHVTGLASKTSTGEEVTDDDNAVTTAESQAFKRACANWTVGRYLYNFPKDGKKYGYDYGRWTDKVPLPDMAYPKIECSETGFPVEDYKFTDKDGNEITWSAEKVINTSKQMFGRILSGEVMARISREKREAEEAAAAETPAPKKSAAKKSAANKE